MYVQKYILIGRLLKVVQTTHLSSILNVNVINCKCKYIAKNLYTYVYEVLFPPREKSRKQKPSIVSHKFSIFTALFVQIYFFHLSKFHIRSKKETKKYVIKSF